MNHKGMKKAQALAEGICAECLYRNQECLIVSDSFDPPPDLRAPGIVLYMGRYKQFTGWEVAEARCKGYSPVSGGARRRTGNDRYYMDSYWTYEGKYKTQSDLDREKEEAEAKDAAKCEKPEEKQKVAHTFTVTRWRHRIWSKQKALRYLEAATLNPAAEILPVRMKQHKSAWTEERRRSHSEKMSEVARESWQKRKDQAAKRILEAEQKESKRLAKEKEDTLKRQQRSEESQKEMAARLLLGRKPVESAYGPTPGAPIITTLLEGRPPVDPKYPPLPRPMTPEEEARYYKELAQNWARKPVPSVSTFARTSAIQWLKDYKRRIVSIIKYLT